MARQPGMMAMLVISVLRKHIRRQEDLKFEAILNILSSRPA
jgi:hypothetical protein